MICLDGVSMPDDFSAVTPASRLRTWTDSMQRIVSDFSILAVPQAYLRCRPVLSSSLMWWSTAFSAEASTEAAQLFHFDMSQIKFLKVFIYLTGVSQTNGPHSYVVGSHRRLPRELRDDRRHRDEEVLQHYTAQRITTITGPRGLIFAADTRGLHKGQPLQGGDRLILQLQFSNSSFGDDLPRIMINNRFSTDLLDRIEQLLRTYCMFSKPSSKAASPLDQP